MLFNGPDWAQDAISKQAGVSGDVGAGQSYVVILENKGQEGV